MPVPCTRFQQVAFAALVLGVFVFASAHAGDEKQRVLGSGVSTRVVQAFFERFSKEPECRGYSFTVQERSTKHAGGVRASDKYLFGRIGRPLDGDEKALGKHEIILARIPIGFAIGSNVGLDKISPGGLEAVFMRRITNWRELGGSDAAIVLVGREKTESVLSRLRVPFPFLDEARYHHVFDRDHSVTGFMGSQAGRYAIGFGALANFADLHVLEVDGVTTGLPVGLVVDNSRAEHPVVAAAARLAKSDAWQRRVVNAGYMNAD